MSRPPSNRRRVVIEAVAPEIDAGRHAIKRALGDTLVVQADIFCDGHDELACVLKYRSAGQRDWRETAMKRLVNDRWQGEFQVTQVGRWQYTLEAWIDRFGTWHRDLRKRLAAGQEVGVDLAIGAQLIREAAQRADGDDARRLSGWADVLESGPAAAQHELASSPELVEQMARYADRRLATPYGRELEVMVDRRKAVFSTWYEWFPRSTAFEPGRHGTLRDCQRRLSYVAEMGFDVLYLPPIHPIGQTFRKGPNNRPQAAEGDVGSPWAIGAAEGGHTAIHPALGTIEDFRALREAAEDLGIELALDIAFQCSPDHPYVREHPEWFRRRPDGTIQYAENPPKKYQDIYPFDFDTDAWESLWQELAGVMRYWIGEGVRIFRVDNPHTKPFHFWEWAIRELRSDYPDTIFLSEAFTRPKVMYYLAKVGFTQSYTYFAWRNTKRELEEYFSHLAHSEVAEYFRPNLWPNTPDILTETLQFGGRPAFALRLVLAATLGANYGIYGPAFELCEDRAREPGSEEYLDSEKYQIRQWDWDAPHSLRGLIARINAIRREHPALQQDRTLRFHPIDNEQLICYSKQSPGDEDTILVVANLDVHHVQSGWVELPVDLLGLPTERPYQVHDLLSDGRFLWQGAWNYVELDPRQTPAHVFRIRRHVRTEQQFEYYL